jgi:hypothetical protein
MGGMCRSVGARGLYDGENDNDFDDASADKRLAESDDRQHSVGPDEQSRTEVGGGCRKSEVRGRKSEIRSQSRRHPHPNLLPRGEGIASPSLPVGETDAQRQ